MPALYVMIPAALLIVAVAVYIFFWAVDSGQYDDLDGPAHSVLFDDQDPQHLAAMEQAHAHKPAPDTENADNHDEKPPHA
ncbi:MULTISPECIES: cbb3-type cytochrome oxidase assembly protein CcoS [unclassified Pseudomonas]|uniref:cbb3-type cytochrome oxidase assembly protein CcoS n=1 Tax=unclassified Pseudomonas TaxID=196821 RepID=UPI002AC8B214|nr:MULTISPECIES: cbb3-type cytochrome oxidase assembly protein CcoS [unclassified Pseudomonas]MEB0042892.1 cbb3-type cytochrome oxidase assembly protein CcoS [Pseudomonas sp. MH10]MEB0080254.1 cbb3-type cytochrome oxidase assembly protein CcoS [Pseudomonas sp. MH10out]MEB0093736.1 cbb3-type cytochrome oxidase assembly protein CcoS [Pseudomonas sp. CCI4.2]MEB0103047.1 cbb3-type cytochrome oxidase assembly protein CcoS [Pseudomonas sp. CCI3.2]MEB0123686.1 cbb3-type cytochrome oxidase assembly pr